MTAADKQAISDLMIRLSEEFGSPAGTPLEAMIIEAGELLLAEFLETNGRPPVDFDEFWAFVGHRLWKRN